MSVVEGDSKTASKLLKKKWDYIFFTGSVKVGEIVAMAAAKKLTPYTLELGGKSPAIINRDTDLKLASKRIVRLINLFISWRSAPLGCPWRLQGIHWI